MSEALKRAQKSAEGGLVKALRRDKEIREQIEEATRRKVDWEEELKRAIEGVEAARLVIDTIDAAIAAEAPAENGLTDVTLNLGGNQVVTLKVPAADAKRLTETVSKRCAPFAGWSEPGLKSAVDALEEKVAAGAPAKTPGQISIPIEVDMSGLKCIDPSKLPELRIDLGEGKARIWAETKDLGRIVEMAHELGVGEFATDGIATGPETLGVVGELPGASVIFSGYADRKSLGEEVDKKEWSMFGIKPAPIAVDETVELRLFHGECTRRLPVKVIEIWENANEELLDTLSHNERQSILDKGQTIYLVCDRNRDLYAVNAHRLVRCS